LAMPIEMSDLHPAITLTSRVLDNAGAFMPHSKLMSVSAYVLTSNNAATLEKCLTSLHWVDELLVVDDGSADATLEIARQCGARILHNPFTNFTVQRNFALSHCTGDWIVAIDSDERITPELERELQAELSQTTKYAGFRYPRKSYFMGQWVRSCGW